MSIYIIPLDYKYIRYNVENRPGADEIKDEPRPASQPIPKIKAKPKNLNEAEMKEIEKFNAIWEEIDVFLNTHQAAFIENPYKRCNIRFVADKIAEPLIRKLHELQIPYLAGRDQIDVELFYYYIIGSGRDFYNQTIANYDSARHIWEQRLFEPQA